MERKRIKESKSSSIIFIHGEHIVLIHLLPPYDPPMTITGEY
jgi:hypothetical protein